MLDYNPSSVTLPLVTDDRKAFLVEYLENSIFRNIFFSLFIFIGNL